VVGIGGGFGWYDESSGIPYVSTDNRAIGTLGAEHLLDRGYTRFAYCGLPRNKINGWSKAREQAFKNRVEEAGYTCSKFTGLRQSVRHWARLQNELSAWLASLERPIGLMTCNDIRARHVLEACRNLEIRVPDDIAVVSVDNDEVMCELTEPPLTSIEQNSERIGYEAALLLEKLMRRKKIKRMRTLLGPEGIVVRQSTDILAIENEDVVRAAAFIREHARDQIQVADVLEVVDLSRSTLDKLFLATLGRTIHAEMQRVRIDQAKQYLATTEIPIKQIAERCGFSSLQYFTTVFRQHTACTPAVYRHNRGA
jgi:LacI family transcriptional regulator